MAAAITTVSMMVVLAVADHVLQVDDHDVAV